MPPVFVALSVDAWPYAGLVVSVISAVLVIFLFTSSGPQPLPFTPTQNTVETRKLGKTKPKEAGSLAFAQSAGLPLAERLLVRSEPWYEDGNMILYAHPRIFKVYRGHLASCSPIFKDMLAIGVPQSDDVLDGCIVVTVSDDPVHWEYVLKALFNGTYLSDTPAVKVPFSVAEAFMTLGDKYEIERLYDRATRLLLSRFPLTLEGFRKANDGHAHDPIALEPYAALDFDCINLARRFDFLKILPSAHYACAQLPAMAIFDGMARPDGSRSRLSREDQRANLVGREMMLFIYHKRLFSWIRHTPERCATEFKCLAGKNLFASRVATTWDQDRAIGQVLSGFGALLMRPLGDDVCIHCFLHAKDRLDAAHAAAWENLPLVFALGTWRDICHDD